MSNHLRPEQFIEALDGVLAPRETGHLASCAECQAEVLHLREALADAQRVEPPAPSPLFWEHFSERVRAATAAESMPPRSWWRQPWFRPAGLAAAVAVVALVVAFRPDRGSEETPGSSPVATIEAAPLVDYAALSDDPSWGLVIALATEVDRADLKDVARPAAGTADAMIDELTPAQREALARLLREMGDLE